MQDATLKVGSEVFNVTYYMMSDRIGAIAVGNRETLLHIVTTYSGQPAILHFIDDTAMPIHLMRSHMDHVQDAGLLHRMSFARRPD